MSKGAVKRSGQRSGQKKIRSVQKEWSKEAVKVVVKRMWILGVWRAGVADLVPSRIPVTYKRSTQRSKGNSQAVLGGHNKRSKDHKNWSKGPVNGRGNQYWSKDRSNGEEEWPDRSGQWQRTMGKVRGGGQKGPEAKSGQKGQWPEAKSGQKGQWPEGGGPRARSKGRGKKERPKGAVKRSGQREWSNGDQMKWSNEVVKGTAGPGSLHMHSESCQVWSSTGRICSTAGQNQKLVKRGSVTAP